MTEQPSSRDGFGTNGHLTDEHLAILADPRLSAADGAESESAHLESSTEPLGAAQREHLALCVPCRAAFEATERALVALRDPAAILEPPAELWDRIAAEIAASSDQDRDRTRDQSSDQISDQTPDQRRGVATVTPLNPQDRPQDRRRDRRRAPGSGRARSDGGQTSRSRLWIPLAAAAAGAVLGGAAVAALLGQDDAPQIEPPVAGPTVLGDATLEPVAAEDFTGRAEMVETDAGDLELTIEISAAPDPEAGYFEVWLRDEDGSQLISLGAATAGSNTFSVPAGIDLSQYPVVDVSHEHFDGDPSHSGTTLAAGPMEDAES
ncbi:anti-sigma factor domain-containing protein [Nesterenkonia sp. CF4.4]|uniref:anti-sigma factor domain-containing protein n=1 Tax=Nesterenkonia sp. CF4.4 TaxID=3373079 RepID=UPI003EE5EFDD